MKKFLKKPLNFKPLGFGWKRTHLSRLAKKSLVLETAQGPVEYLLKEQEDRSVILTFHGSPGGFDQSPIFLAELVKKGFSLLSFSRPGYLNTPLESGKTLEEQASLAYNLINALNIKKVILYARASGGPIALLFAKNHPEQTQAVILESAITGSFDLKKSYKKLFPKWLLNDFGIWLYEWMTFIWPKATIRQIMTVESSLTPKQIAEACDHIAKDPKKIYFIFQLIKSLSPLSARSKGIKNDLAQFSQPILLDLTSLKIPTFILHGTHDADIPFSQAEQAAEKITTSTLYTIPEGSHLLPLSPLYKEAQEALFAFLKNLSF